MNQHLVWKRKQYILSIKEVINMVYLDYSATTPADKGVIDAFVIANEEYYANPNSVHSLGLQSHKKIVEVTKTIKDNLKIDNYEIIYTSGATEANNLAIKGCAFKYGKTRKHLLTSKYEHSSVTACFNYLADKGFDVEVVDSDSHGRICLDDLKKKLRDDTLLVSIAAVNSETGIAQDLKSISNVIKTESKAFFHSDVTQALSKMKVDFNLLDLASFSAHKFYGLKGIGALIKTKDIDLEPIIHGGKSFSKYRSGTMPTPLIVSLGEALDIAINNQEERIEKVSKIHNLLVKELSDFDSIVLNSNEYSIKQIVNVSFLNLTSKKISEALSERSIFVSTTTACASESAYSLAVEHLTGSKERAKSAIRISLSHLTTEAEIIYLIKALKEILS